MKHWIVAVLLCSACGAQVVFGDDEDDGSGAAGAGGSGDGANDPVGPGGNTPNTFEEACKAACETIAACESQPGACFDRCMASDSSCQTRHLEFLNCAAERIAPGVCDMPLSCVASMASWLDCESWCIEGTECGEGSDGTCQCTLPACGPTSVYDSICDPSGKCSCFRDGFEVGSCVETNQVCGQDVELSCCLTLLFVPGG